MSAAASAKMALAFAELTGGVKFDGKKHRAVMSRFSAKKNHGGGGGGSGSARAGEGASGSGRAGGHDSGDTSDKNKKKQKDLASRERERARGVAERADDDAVEVFGTRRQKLGKPSGGRADVPSRGKRVKDDTRGGADRVSRDAPDASPRDTDSEAHDGSDSLETGLRAALREASAPRRAASQTEEAAAALRKKHKIRVRDAGGEGRCPPPLSGGFDELAARYPGIGCGKMLLGRLAEAGFHEPTPIQRQAIPALLENHELLAVAPTGSGKTLAFLLPIVCALRSKDDTAGGPRALLLSPTKELAQQSHRILRLLCRGVNTIRRVRRSRRSRRLVFVSFSFRAPGDDETKRASEMTRTRGRRGIKPPLRMSGTWERWRSNPPSRAITQPMDARLEPTDPRLFSFRSSRLRRRRDARTTPRARTRAFRDSRANATRRSARARPDTSGE